MKLLTAEEERVRSLLPVSAADYGHAIPRIQYIMFCVAICTYKCQSCLAELVLPVMVSLYTPSYWYVVLQRNLIFPVTSDTNLYSLSKRLMLITP